MTTETDFYLGVGGRPVPYFEAEEAYGSDAGDETVWDFGYLDAQRRGLHDDTAATADEVIGSIPAFALQGRLTNDPKKVFLWDFAKRVNGGQHFQTFRQVTGSCVGNGLGQALRITSACDQAMRSEPEDGAKLNFWLLAYGWSRQIAGMRGRGEGSFGGAAVKAAATKGFPPADLAGLPRPDTSDGVSYGRAAELEWSFGPQQPRGAWDGVAAGHLVLTAGRCRSHADVREALRSGYGCTCASMWGGEMRPRVQDGVLLNRRATQWAHQMCIIGWWDHPSHGELFYVLNSWGPRAHGDCPSGAPPGGFWVRPADIDFMCADEVYALSNWKGFPARDLPFWLI